MAIDTGIGISIDLVSTITAAGDGAQAPLGQTLLKPAGISTQGEQVWIYIKAGDSLVAGDICARDTTVATLGSLENVIKVPASSATSRVVGVAQHAIPAGSFGWVLKSGVGALTVVVPASTTESAGEAVVVSGTPGQATAAGAGADAFGFLTQDLANGTGSPVVFATTAVINCNG